MTQHTSSQNQSANQNQKSPTPDPRAARAELLWKQRFELEKDAIDMQAEIGVLTDRVNRLQRERETLQQNREYEERKYGWWSKQKFDPRQFERTAQLLLQSLAKAEEELSSATHKLEAINAKIKLIDREAKQATDPF